MWARQVPLAKLPETRPDATPEFAPICPVALAKPARDTRPESEPAALATSMIPFATCTAPRVAGGHGPDFVRNTALHAPSNLLAAYAHGAAAVAATTHRLVINKRMA